MKYEYLIDNRGKYVVPNTTKTVDDRLKRDKDFQKTFNVKPLIVSKDYWQYLLAKYSMKTVTVKD